MHSYRWSLSFLGILLPGWFNALSAQVVTLPTLGNFSVQTSVLVPDSGSASLGSNRSSASGSLSRGAGPLANRSAGGRVGLPSTSVTVNMIDLEFLDQAILAAAEKNGSPELQNGSIAPPATRRTTSDNPSTLPNAQAMAEVRAPSTARKEPRSRTADYDYMALLNHPNDPSIVHDYAGDVRFFLQQAKFARDGRHWASVQLFYEQAWNKLPPQQQRQVLEKLAKQQDAKSKSKSTATKL